MRRIAISFDVVIRHSDRQASPIYALPIASGSGHSAALAPGLAEAASTAQAGSLDADRFFGLALKRALDVGISATLLVLLSPLLALIYLAIRATSSGPAIFRQTRIGLDGTSFNIYKFRTMTVMENGSSVIQAARSDRRVTRLGTFLRRSSLDELPQLANVLKGDMSLIGPRPHAAAHDREFASQVANYAMRRRMKPGITGWAQVNGARGGIDTVEDIRRRVDLDLQYIERWNFGLDLYIFIYTAFIIVNTKNAY